jgi:hypothetical protein
MEERKTLGRREFTVASVLAALSGVTITVTSCGGGSSYDGSPTTPSSPSTPMATPTPTPPEGDVFGSISANHGHEARITAARLADPMSVDLDIRGGADHPHTVSLSADEVQQIADGQQVVKTSSTTQSHNHLVTFN